MLATDVEGCIDAVQLLAAQDLVDSARTMIRAEGQDCGIFLPALANTHKAGSDALGKDTRPPRTRNRRSQSRWLVSLSSLYGVTPPGANKARWSGSRALVSLICPFALLSLQVTNRFADFTLHGRSFRPSGPGDRNDRRNKQQRRSCRAPDP